MSEGLPPLRRVQWRRAQRIIPSRYPPIQLFERVADPEEWETLAEIEGLTNDRLRQEVGEISLVAVEERIGGPGASWVMAAFTHVGRSSRFSDGAYGVYYAARTLQTAVAETSYHMGRFFAATGEPPSDVDMRVLVNRFDARFHDLRGGGGRWSAMHDSADYAAAQALGRQLRESGSNGIVYRSVRDHDGQCIAAFRPKAVGAAHQAGHLRYHWNGQQIDRYFDYGKDHWFVLESPD